MQLVFVTLFLIFILLPGISFRVGYLKRDGLVTVAGSKVYMEFAFYIFISTIIHLVSYFIVEIVPWYDFDINLFYSLVSGNNNHQTVSLEDNEWSIARFLFYNFIVSIALFRVGFELNKYLYKTQFEFPENFRFLDNTGYWDRILFTDILKEVNANKRRNEEQIKELEEKYRQIKNDNPNDNDLARIQSLIKINQINLQKYEDENLNITLSVLTQVANSEYLYEGTLIQYFVDKYGHIDKIILKHAKRISLKDFDEKEMRKKGIEITLKEEKENFLKDYDSDKLLNKGKFSLRHHNHFVIYGSTIRNVCVRLPK